MADAAPPQLYRCRRCQSEFSAIRTSRRPPTVCQPCQTYKAKLRNLWWKFGLTEQAFLLMNEQQDHRCAICRLPAAQNLSRTLYVDHCHTTGRIRGLLCHACNCAISLLRDDPQVILAAAIYLEGTNDTNRGTSIASIAA